MLVSIITPNYNSEKYIRDAIRSVQAQTFSNWEMLIVDDCSSDNSPEIIREHLSDERIRFFRLEKNAGPVAARNYAIEQAHGDIVAFLDSDDIWHADKLEKQVAVYNQHNGAAALVFANYEHIDENGIPLNHLVIAPPSVGYNDLLKTCSIGCLTATYNVKLLGKRYLLPYGHEDYILWLSILKEGHRAVNVGEVLAKYRISSSSISGNKLKAAGWQWNIYRNIEKIGLFKSIYYFVSYAYHGMRKHW